MLFLQIVAILTLAVLLIVSYWALFHGQKPREVPQIQSVAVIGKLVVIHRPPDTYSVQTEYQLASTPPEAKAPIVILQRFYDGESDIQFGMTTGQAPVERLGEHKLALLEEALPDIRGRLVNKKA